MLGFYFFKTNAALGQSLSQLLTSNAVHRVFATSFFK